MAGAAAFRAAGAAAVVAVDVVAAGAVVAAASRRDADRQAGGFGVRVIHSGVWGFASSPIVTEDEIRRITRVAVEVARASAIAKKTRRAARAGPGVRRELRHADDEEPDHGLADRQAGVGAGDRRQGEQGAGRHRA